MSKDVNILTAIKPLPYQGMNLFDEAWDTFVESLIRLLKESGFQHQNSSNELIIFTFPNENSAISVVLAVINTLRKQFKQIKPDIKLPLQCIIHLNENKDNLPAIFTSDAEDWEMLEMETIYVTRSLKSKLEILLARQQLPPCTMNNVGNGLFELQLTGDANFPNEGILAFRKLPIQGSGKPCFYCGMQSHTPAECPSKFLSMNDNGLELVGYLPFKQLNIIYKKTFTSTDKIVNQLAAGIPPQKMRKDPCLIVYVAFMDISRIYQLRFLWNISFSVYNKWESIFNSDKLALDNKNLQLGLDCLRVKQYGRAEELLLKECHHKSPKRFYATVGLAFLALERGRLADMKNHLGIASNLAVQEKERLYVAMLLAKFYDLNNETWKARDLIKNTLAIKNDCQELLYSKVQLEVRGSFKESAFQLLRSLMMDQRQLYMTVLLDPLLYSIQTKVENILLAQYQTLAHSAQTNLAQARDEINELKLWFTGKAPEMKNDCQILQNLEKSFVRKSYFDVLDVAGKAKALHSSTKSMREKKLNELYDQANVVLAKWNGYYHFWTSYQFPNFFKNFHQHLLPIKKKISLIRALAKKNSGGPYRQAVHLLKEVDDALQKIEPIYHRMNWVSLLFSGGLIFCKKIFIVEIVLAIICIVAAIILGSLPADSPLSSLAALTATPWFQKKFGLFIALLVAPFIALMLTMQKMTK